MIIKQLIDKIISLLSRKGFVYLSVGLIAFCIEYLSFLLIFNQWSSLFLAQTVSFCIGLVISFNGNRMYTFSEGDFRNSVKKQILLYLILAIVNVIFTNVMIYTLVSLGIHPLVAKVIVMGVVIIWNFIIFNKIIFKSKKATITQKIVL